MNHAPDTRKRVAWTSLLLLLILVGVPVWLTWRAVRQDKLDRALIAAIKENNASAVVSLLNQGADAHAQDTMEVQPISFRHRLLDWLRGRRSKQPPGQDALMPALNWQPLFRNTDRPYGDVPPEEYDRNAAIVKALLDHGADANTRRQSDWDGAYFQVNNISWHMNSETPLITAILAAYREGELYAGPGGFGQSSYQEQAAKRRCERQIRLLLNHGADVNGTDEAGRTPLMVASFLYQTWLVKLLLDKGAKVNPKDKEGTTALAVALNTDNRGEGLRYVDASSTIRLLIAHKAGVDVHSPAGKAAFVYVAGFGYKDLVEKLLAEGMDVNSKDARDDTALTATLNSEHSDTAKLLLEKGADPNLPGGEDDVSIGSGSRQWKFSRETPLICAVGYSWLNPPPIPLLLDKGADINGKDAEGRTALIWAAFEGDDRALSFLLKRGADPNIADRYGETALSVARKEKEHEGINAVWKILTQAGVKR